MNRLIMILDTYNDLELSYMANYKLKSYSHPTQEKIIDYLKKRGLNRNKINEIIANHEKNKASKNSSGCPRCGSNKIVNEEANSILDTAFTFIRFRRTRSNKIIKETCQVCGYLISNPNNDKI